MTSSSSSGGGRRRAAALSAAGALALAVWLGSSSRPVSAVQGCPNPPVPGISGSSVPEDVCIPAGFGSNPIDFFDDFSWRAFIAMVWPVKDGERGVPDTAKRLGSPGPRVFETFKAQWEVFHGDGGQPAEWNVYDSSNACGVTPKFGELVLASFSKFSDVGMAGFGKLLGPLVAQNKTYVRYLTGISKSEFDLIRSKELYLRKNLPTGSNSLTFDNGSIDVKSAWIDMTGIVNKDRYYTRTALVSDPAPGGKCETKTVGLLALHIVVKTPSRPQWIWSSFEHVDLTPQAGARAPFALHAGDQKPMPDNNPFPINPLITPPPAPFNVTRLKPIHTKTQQTNAAYHKLLTAEQSIWRFYQLVMTQWPKVPNSPSTPGSPANTFPGSAPGEDQTAFSNLALETFEQDSIITGCMACHNVTRQKTDFLWVLDTRAFPAKVPGLLSEKDELTELRDLLHAAHQLNAKKKKNEK